MIEKTMVYKDFKGNERTETMCFHLSEAEFMDIEFGGLVNGRKLTAYIEELMNPSTQEEKSDIQIKRLADALIDRSYGVISEDGRRFIKSPEKLKEFKQTEAYSLFLMELYKNEGKFMNFILELLPSEYRAAAEKEIAEKAAERNADTSASA